MVNLLNLIDFKKIFLNYYYMLILNSMPASCFKQVGTRATKDCESCGMLLFGTCHTGTGSLVTDDNIMIGHEEHPLKAQSFTSKH